MPGQTSDMPTRMTPSGWSFADRDQKIALPNEAALASDMRAFVGHCLGREGVPEDVKDEVLMAVGEVVANACRHGRRPAGGGEVELECTVRDRQVWVKVSDDGPGFDVAAVLPSGIPDVLSQGGRGFFLMRQLMDKVDVSSSPEGTCVVLERRLP